MLTTKLARVPDIDRGQVVEMSPRHATEGKIFLHHCPVTTDTGGNDDMTERSRRMQDSAAGQQPRSDTGNSQTWSSSAQLKYLLEAAAQY